MNNAWSQIDCGSLSSPSAHWLPGSQAGAPLSSPAVIGCAWRAVEEMGNHLPHLARRRWLPAPHCCTIVSAAAAPLRDLWLTLVGNAAAQSCHLDTYYRPRPFFFSPLSFLKGSSAAQLRPQGSFFLLTPFLSLPPGTGFVIVSHHSFATITLVASASASTSHTLVPPRPANPPTIPLSSKI